MKPEINSAETLEQRERVFRFRYDTYVEEMGRYKRIADHDRRLLIEPEDDTARLYLATDGDEAVGSMRHNWGGDADICDRQIAQYSIEPFLETVPKDQMIVGERFMVAPAHRGTDLIFRMFKTYLEFANDKRIQLIFGDCEPHLLNLYLGMGFRTYAAHNVNSPQTGYLIPLVMVPEDLGYMRRINSPLIKLLKDFGDEARVPEGLEDMLGTGGGVVSHTLAGGEDYFAQVEGSLKLAQSPANLFDGLSEDEQQRCLAKSNAIECKAGDHLIKKGNVAQNMFVVLAGTLEVKIDNRVVNVCTAGDIVGEMAFILESPRSADVWVATDDTRVLSLSESNLKKLSAAEPELAAKLLLNLSKLLCHKILRNS